VPGAIVPFSIEDGDLGRRLRGQTITVWHSKIGLEGTQNWQLGQILKRLRYRI
jgi:hypothetical protein